MFSLRSNDQICFFFCLTAVFLLFGCKAEESSMEATNHSSLSIHHQFIDEELAFFKAPFSFDYPDAVRGIYVTGPSVGNDSFHQLLQLVEETDLNTMVIDLKEDEGRITFTPEEESIYDDVATDYIKDPIALMQILEEKNIYPIARIVVFKDSLLAEKRPDLSFTEQGKVWTNNRGEAFVNPFEKEVWNYNIEIAKMAAEMGFQDIQFDYVRFPEGFEHRDETLDYSLGDYEANHEDQVQRRVEAVTDFVAYAYQELQDYDIDLSIDLFGYAATISETPGIGQNFLKIAEEVDVISSMIYPSHWSEGAFGVEFPDEQPYELISEYAKLEKKLLNSLDNPPRSRPWLQDFEAPWLYEGPVKKYGKEEVEAQIKALNENGIDEFLLWNAGNIYTQNVNYVP